MGEPDVGTQRLSRSAIRCSQGSCPPIVPPSSRRLEGADLILVLGAPVFTYHVEGHGPHVPAGAALVQLTDDPGAAARCPVGTSIVTHLKLGVAALAGSIHRSSLVHRRARAPRAASSARGSVERSLPDAANRRARPPDSIIVEEAPSSRGAMHEYLPMLERKTFYTCASGGLGHGLPAAVGVALARPGRKVIGLARRRLRHVSIQGLWTAAELGLPVSFIIVNNRSYRALEEFGRHFDIDTLPGVRAAASRFLQARARSRRARHPGRALP